MVPGTYAKSKENMFKHVKNSFRPPNKTSQKKVVASQIEEIMVDDGASRHMISNNELPSGETDTIRRSKEPTVITTANRKT